MSQKTLELKAGEISLLKGILQNEVRTLQGVIESPVISAGEREAYKALAVSVEALLIKVGALQWEPEPETTLPTQPRNISAIAEDIRRVWGSKVNYAAKPYLDAMMYLDVITDKYCQDDAKSIIVYFLANASTFRGDQAKALKAELKKIAGIK